MNNYFISDNHKAEEQKNWGQSECIQKIINSFSLLFKGLKGYISKHNLDKQLCFLSSFLKQLGSVTLLKQE